MSNYHVEERSYPEFESEVVTLPTIRDVDGMECPKCGGRMVWTSDWPEECYVDDGTFESTERFYCDDCGTFADVTQVYEATVRRVRVAQDVFED